MYFHHLQLFKKFENNANNFKNWYNYVKIQESVNLKIILIKENTQNEKTTSKQVFYFIKLFLLIQPNMFFFKNKKSVF